MSRAAKYYTYRDGPDAAERQWQTSDGRITSYAAIKSEVRAAAKTYGYSYRMVLSTRDGDIGAAGYHAVLAERFARYYFIEHHNTDFAHAHVLGFRKQRFTKAELRAMRGTLAELEQAQVQARAVTRAPDQVEVPLAGRSPLRDQARGAGLDR